MKSFSQSLMQLSVLSLCVAVAAGGCSKNKEDGSSSTESKTESLTYEYELNGCKTGSHTFSSKAEFCKGLQDQKLNKGCALSLREQTFKSDRCDGEFEEINLIGVTEPSRPIPVTPPRSPTPIINTVSVLAHLTGAIDQPSVTKIGDESVIVLGLKVKLDSVDGADFSSDSRIVPGNGVDATYTVPSKKMELVFPSIGECKEFTVFLSPLTIDLEATLTLDARAADPTPCVELFKNMSQESFQFKYSEAMLKSGRTETTLKGLNLVVYAP